MNGPESLQFKSLKAYTGFVKLAKQSHIFVTNFIPKIVCDNLFNNKPMRPSKKLVTKSPEAHINADYKWQMTVINSNNDFIAYITGGLIPKLSLKT